MNETSNCHTDKQTSVYFHTRSFNKNDSKNHNNSIVQQIVRDINRKIEETEKEQRKEIANSPSSNSVPIEKDDEKMNNIVNHNINTGAQKSEDERFCQKVDQCFANIESTESNSAICSIQCTITPSNNPDYVYHNRKCFQTPNKNVKSIPPPYRQSVRIFSLKQSNKIITDTNGSYGYYTGKYKIALVHKK
ncbi:hypothetical protein SNEBB_007645 [Seison nebaliae]|nr:hypothetical protein SNEBB_007645 [Seison nebaliae]